MEFDSDLVSLCGAEANTSPPLFTNFDFLVQQSFFHFVGQVCLDSLVGL